MQCFEKTIQCMLMHNYCFAPTDNRKPPCPMPYADGVY